MATRQKRAPYKNPKAPDGTKGPKKAFIVADKAQVYGEGGKKYIAGDTVPLNEKMANFYANLGYIVINMEFDDGKDAKIAKLTEELAGQAPDDADEAGAGDDAEPSGGEPSDGPVPPTDDEAEKPASKRRRRSL